MISIVVSIYQRVNYADLKSQPDCKSNPPVQDFATIHRMSHPNKTHETLSICISGLQTQLLRSHGLLRKILKRTTGACWSSRNLPSGNQAVGQPPLNGGSSGKIWKNNLSVGHFPTPCLITGGYILRVSHCKCFLCVVKIDWEWLMFFQLTKGSRVIKLNLCFWHDWCNRQVPNTNQMGGNCDGWMKAKYSFLPFGSSHALNLCLLSTGLEFFL